MNLRARWGRLRHRHGERLALRLLAVSTPITAVLVPIAAGRSSDPVDEPAVRAKERF